MNEDGEILQTLSDPDAKQTKILTLVSTLKDGRFVLGRCLLDFYQFLSTVLKH